MKIFEEIFYCDIPVFKNYPATQLKCFAYRCEDNTLFINGYYEFFVDEDQYLAHYRNCQIKTRDEEMEWIDVVFDAIIEQIYLKFNIDLELIDQEGFWCSAAVPTIIIKYVYDNDESYDNDNDDNDDIFLI
jgi:hypothetical protein